MLTRTLMMVSGSSPGHPATKTVYNSHGTYTYVVPAGVTVLTAELWGASGGTGTDTSSYPSVSGGNYALHSGGGGYTKVDIPVNPGDSYTIVVGQGGNAGSSTGSIVGAGGGGGRQNSSFAGGGGGGGSSIYANTPGYVAYAGGGGGAGVWATPAPGTYAGPSGGGGGGTSGDYGGIDTNPADVGTVGQAGGGTQSAGGAGGNGTTSSGIGGGVRTGGAGGSYTGGGGGGGWWGGGGGAGGFAGEKSGGGAGGSGYYNPAATTKQTLTTASGINAAGYSSGNYASPAGQPIYLSGNTAGNDGRVVIY